MSTVAVVGLGAMGSRIASRLLSQGHEVVVWNRTSERAVALAEQGATMTATPAEAAARAEVVVIMVSDAAALRAVTEGPSGLIADAAPSPAIIQMSTVGSSALSRLASMLPKDAELLDAPVLGSVSEAESGALRIFVGGERSYFERWRPLLSALGSPLHVGPLGAGTAAKLVANCTLFGALGVLGEALALADGLGLSREAAWDVLEATPLAAQAERRRGSVERGDYPPRFVLSLARKDADLIAEAAAGSGVELRLLAAARAWLAEAEDAGRGNSDYSSVLAEILSRRERSRARTRDATADAGARATGSSALPFDGLVVDLDGVVWVGQEPVPGSVETLRQLRAHDVPLVFLTNDPTGARADYATRLTQIGLDVDEAGVVTSGSALASLIRDREGPGTTTFVIGSPSLKRELERVGLELRSGESGRTAEVAAVGGHDGFNYDELRIAGHAVHRGARLYAAGRDPTFPMPDGPWPATGSILAAVETATGVHATVAGKPEPYIFELARSILVGCDRVAIVGDHLAADIVGGRRAGLMTILVLTGTTSRGDLAAAETTPDIVLDDLAGLLEMRA